MPTKVKKKTVRKRTVIKARPKREVVLFAKVTKANKTWVEKQAKRANLTNAEYIDTLLTSNRTGKKLEVAVA